MKVRFLILSLLAALPLFADLPQPAVPNVAMFGPRTYNAAAGAHVSAHETVATNATCDKTGTTYSLIVTNGNADGTGKVSAGSVKVNGVEVAATDLAAGTAVSTRAVTITASTAIDVSFDGPAAAAAVLKIELWRRPALTVLGTQTYSIPASSTHKVFDMMFDAIDPAMPASIVVSRTGAFLTADALTVAMNGTSVVTRSSFTASPQTVTKPVTLQEISNLLHLDVSTGTTASTVTVQVIQNGDSDYPSITLGPIPTITATSPFTLRGTVTDSSGCASLTLNGTTAIPVAADGTFSTNVALVHGANQFTVVAYDCAGNGASASAQPAVFYDTDPPVVTITAPAANALVNTTSVVVSGTVHDDGPLAPTVKVNNVSATVSAFAGTWKATVPLPAGDGAKTLTAVATDRVARTATAASSVTLDATPPSITATPSPVANAAGWNKGPVTVSFTCTDASGVTSCAAPVSVTAEGIQHVTGTAVDAAGNSKTIDVPVQIDLTDPFIVTAADQAVSADGWAHGNVMFSFTCGDSVSAVGQCSSPVTLLASGGEQTVSGTAVDLAGNSATSSRTIRFDASAPALTVDAVPPVVHDYALTLTGTVSDIGSGLRNVTCGVTRAVVTGSTYQCALSLTAGVSSIAVTASDVAGNLTQSTVTTRVDRTAPSIAVTSPAEGVITSEDSIHVTGTVSDDDQIASASVGGTAITGSSFDVDVPLADGANAIDIQTTDRAGNTATTTVHVTRFAVPAVTITAPRDLVILQPATITVTGTINDPHATVSVNGVPATVAGGTFTASGVSLQQGRTVITATAVNTLGRAATASINVYRDSIPPRVTVESPADNATVYDSPITVSGMIDDIVVGTINSAQMTVTVNGTPAAVSNRTYSLRNVPLTLGANALVVVATDAGGNQATVTQHVTLANAPKPRLAVVSGDGQSAPIGTRLAQPVTVQALSAAGVPLRDVAVSFDIVENDGSVGNGATSGYSFTVVTDASGKAAAQWTLGSRAGAGNNRLRMSAVGFASPVEAEAVATTAAPALIVVDSGNDQLGVTGQPLARPLVAIVVDAGNNRLAGVPVTFHVNEGAGTFGGQSSTVVTTDSDGRAIAVATLGAAEGQDNNIFAASVSGATVAAVFRASGRNAGVPSQTRISGVVLDNSSLPLAGVTVRIDGTTTAVQTNAQGQFSIASAPVGYVKLFVDGSTAQRTGTWPTLEYALYTLPGIDNVMTSPVYLVQIDNTHGLFVDDTTGGTLTVAELPGFALRILPGSVTFPGGGRTGTVSATLVHADRIPMAPGFGQQPKFIVTIQPAGAHFDPPAQLTFPNVDGLKAGEITEMYSFDHDLGQFVSIGTGTVSSDGSVITSDPGVGIIKAGWHCGGNPSTTGTSAHCGECALCTAADGGCIPLPPGPPRSCSGKDACKSYSCDGVNCVAHDPFRLEVYYVDRDDASRDWGSLLKATDGQPFFGGDVATADWVRFQAVPLDPKFNNATFTWSAAGPQTYTGPTGQGADTWNIEGILWKPGIYEVTCQISTGSSCSTTLKWKAEVGIRTNEYIAYGGIKREDFPPELTGIATSMKISLICPTFGFVVVTNSIPHQPFPWPGLTREERLYVYYRILQTTSDEIIDPDPNGQRDVFGTAFGLSPDRNYRFMGRAQYKFLVENGAFKAGWPVAVGQNLALVGETTAPCGMSWLPIAPDPDGVNPPDNGISYMEDGTWVYQVKTRAGYFDQWGFRNLLNRELPFVLLRFRFRPDSPQLASNFNVPSMSFNADDHADFTLMPTISFYRRYWDGSTWRVERIFRSTQRALDFAALGTPTASPAYP